jgi:hypothetical protein
MLRALEERERRSATRDGHGVTLDVFLESGGASTATRRGALARNGVAATRP